MTDTVAKIAAKGCNATGITEELATRLHDQLGKKLMAVVELEAAARTEKSDGNQAVQLRILSVEPATDQLAEDHLREFARALYYNRAVDEAQPTLDGGGNDEPTVAEVTGRGKSLLEHDEQGDVIGLWDGNTEPDGQDGDDEVDPYDLVHSTSGAAPGADTTCGLRATFGKSLHTHPDAQQVTCGECKSALEVAWDGDTSDDREPVDA